MSKKYKSDLMIKKSRHINYFNKLDNDTQKDVLKRIDELVEEEKESDVDLDINGDGDKTDTISLKIEYDTSKYSDTNGYGGTYLDFYLAEFVSNLQWYVDNLDYGDGFTWFDSDGNALSDSDVANMSTSDKAKAFIEGRYASSSSKGSMGGAPSGNMQGGPGGSSDSSSSGMPSRNPPSDMGNTTGKPSGNPPSEMGNMTGGPGGTKTDSTDDSSSEEVGTPDKGTTQSATSSKNSSNYSTFKEMYEAYKEDIDEVYSGDKYGKNIVNLYDPLQYIGANTTKAPTWTRILMGASEGDMSMFSSLNMQAKWLQNGTNGVIDWQWNGGHVPSEILGDSFSLYVDQMYGKYVNGAKTITKANATKQSTNGTESSANGTDISSWVNLSNGKVSFDLADAASYRTSGASKAIPGFDVMDYGQEDYVFGSTEKDARHWDKYVLTSFEENYSELESLFNGEQASSSSNANNNSTTIYIIVGSVCTVILLGIVVGIVIKKKKK